MKLAKAIEILATQVSPFRGEHNPDLRDAIKLGIGALKRVQHYRQINRTYRERPLPSEDPK